MGLWGPVSAANLERVGLFDLYVGSDGRTSDLFAAYTTHGARKIMLGPGATLSADLTISAGGVYVWSPFHPRILSLGNKKLTITGDNCYLAGFAISGAPAVGIEVASSARVYFERVAVESCGSHGIHFNSGGNDSNVDRCYLATNTGDGIRFTSTSHANVRGCTIYGNTGYGVNDLANASILVANRIAANTAGQINGTPSVNTGNKTT